MSCGDCDFVEERLSHGKAGYSEAKKGCALNFSETRLIFRLRSRSSIARSFVKAFGILVAGYLLLLTGCQDGPLYSLKIANPYYSLKEWGEEKAYGKNDHERWQEMLSLSQSIDNLSESEQAEWVKQFTAIIENDESAEMRRLVMVAAAKLVSSESLALIETGLKDPSIKVRMEACRSLGERGDESSARMLASAFGSETNQDVKNSAVAAMALFSDEIAIDSLRIALSDRNPATRSMAVQSLKKSTGKDYGDDPDEWIAALDGQPVEKEPARFADRIMDLF